MTKSPDWEVWNRHKGEGKCDKCGSEKDIHVNQVGRMLCIDCFFKHMTTGE